MLFAGMFLGAVMSRCILPRTDSIMLFASHPERYFQPVCWSLHGRILLIIWFHPRPVHCLKLPLVCYWSVLGRFLDSKKTTIRLMVFLLSFLGFPVGYAKTTLRLMVFWLFLFGLLIVFLWLFYGLFKDQCDVQLVLYRILVGIFVVSLWFLPRPLHFVLSVI